MAAARQYATPVAALAAIVLFFLYDPWVIPPDDARPSLAVIFWIAAIATVVLLFQDRRTRGGSRRGRGPRVHALLFSNTRAGLFWLPMRSSSASVAGAGWAKFSGHGWVDGGFTLLGTWRAPSRSRSRSTTDHVRVVPPVPPDPHRRRRPGLERLAYHRQRARRRHRLLVRALIRIAAFFGATMNVSYMLAARHRPIRSSSR